MTWRRFFRRAQADAELQQELESYLDITAAEYMAQGVGQDEARRAARRKLGNLTRIREAVHHVNTAHSWKAPSGICVRRPACCA